MGTPIKRGVSAGTMAALKTHLAVSDGGNRPLVPAFHLSLGGTHSGNGKCGFFLIVFKLQHDA